MTTKSPSPPITSAPWLALELREDAANEDLEATLAALGLAHVVVPGTGYVLVQAPTLPPGARHRLERWVRRVLPASVPAADVERLRRRLRPRPRQLAPGALVRVVAGPWAGLAGVVVEPLPTGYRIAVELRSRRAEVDVAPAEVEPASGPRRRTARPARLASARSGADPTRTVPRGSGRVYGPARGLHGG